MRSRFVLDPSAGLELPLRGLLDADADRCAALDEPEHVPDTFKLKLRCGTLPFESCEELRRLADESYLSCNGGSCFEPLEPDAKQEWISSRLTGMPIEIR